MSDIDTKRPSSDQVLTVVLLAYVAVLAFVWGQSKAKAKAQDERQYAGLLSRLGVIEDKLEIPPPYALGMSRSPVPVRVVDGDD